MKGIKPFVKWAGGKNQLLDQLENFFPSELKNGQIKKYVEPFLGGGAVYFSICKKFDIKSAYLSDVNKDLIMAYMVVQQKPNALIDALKQMQDEYNSAALEKRKKIFLAARDSFNKGRFEIAELDRTQFADNWIIRTAQFIFLNKTCFNGLFRLNSKGEFNVPHGKYKTASIFDEENILSASAVLQNAVISHSVYSDCYDQIDADTFVYFDPPYRPLTRTAKFTSYTDAEFSDQQQLELADFYRKIDSEKHAKLMLSNSDPANIDPNDNFFEKAYNGYRICKLSASRAINCKADKRGKINELLITNYAVG